MKEYEYLLTFYIFSLLPPPPIISCVHHPSLYIYIKLSYAGFSIQN